MTETAHDYERTFICIPVTQQTRSALSLIHRHAKAKAPGLSCQNPDYAHITLAFLGRISSEVTAEIAAGLDGICGRIQSFRFSVGGGGFFGSRKQPKVLWVGIPPSSGLSTLQGQIAGVVRNAGVALEPRPFKPHLTVARVRTALPPGSLTSIMTCINNTNFAEIMVDHVLLMNSRLNGPGPRFTTIHQALLKGS